MKQEFNSETIWYSEPNHASRQQIRKLEHGFHRTTTSDETQWLQRNIGDSGHVLQSSVTLTDELQL